MHVAKKGNEIPTILGQGAPSFRKSFFLPKFSTEAVVEHVVHVVHGASKLVQRKDTALQYVVLSFFCALVRSRSRIRRVFRFVALR